MLSITKAIIPVAGFGTRFLPATKAQPKEMLPVVDKPIIQYVVEEAVAAGIKDIILITGQNKRAIEDHFDRNFELEYRLKQKGDLETLFHVQRISNLANFIYIRQKTPRGDGDAVLQAKRIVKDESCAVLFGDDIVDSSTPCVKQLLEVYKKYHDPILAIQETERKNISKYGIIKGVKIEERTWQVESLVEKPRPEKAPSNLGIIGKYVITPEILWILEKIQKSLKGEVRLINAFQKFIKNRSLYAYQFKGKRYDCGDKLGFLKATVDFGLKHKDLRKDFMDYIKKLKKE